MSKTPYSVVQVFKKGEWIYPDDIFFLSEFIYNMLNNNSNVNEMYVYSNYLTKAKLFLISKKKKILN